MLSALSTKKFTSEREERRERKRRHAKAYRERYRSHINDLKATYEILVRKRSQHLDDLRRLDASIGLRRISQQKSVTYPTSMHLSACSTVSTAVPIHGYHSYDFTPYSNR